MRVLVMVPDLKYKGGVTNFYRCLMLYEEPGIDYMYVNTSATDPESNPGVNQKSLVLKKIWHLPVIYFRFVKKASSYDIVHVNPSLNPKAFFRDVVFVFLARMMKRRTIVFFHGWDDDFESRVKSSRLISVLFKHTYAMADAHIVLGSVFKERIIALGVPPLNKIYIETTIADSRYIEFLDIEDKIDSFGKQINFLFISRVLKSKGIYIAMDACAACNAMWPHRNIRLFIAGDGEELESAKKYAVEHGYSNIEFLGYLDDEARGNILSKCHIMIFPTYYGEGLPSTIVEGMLFGMPIISRPVGGIPDVVKDGVNGYLSESMDGRAFAEICSKFIMDKDLYSQMARLNHQIAKESFVIDASKKRLLSIYEDIVS